MKYEIVILATFSGSETANSGFIKSLDPQSSSRLYAAFLSDCIRKALLVVEKPIVYLDGSQDELRRAVEALLGGSPAGAPSAGRDMAGVIDWRVSEPGGFADPLAAVGRPCLVMLGDSPTLPVDYMAQAAARVAVDDVVIGPAIDGGFYLLGLRSPAPALFDGLHWGIADLFTRVRERAAQLDLSTRLLPPWYRVGTQDELRRLELELETLPVNSNDDCPYTRAALATLGR